MGPVCGKVDENNLELNMVKQPVVDVVIKPNWGQLNDEGEQRWILFDKQDLLVDEATAVANEWCETQNKLVYGKYTFIQHNVKAVPRTSQRLGEPELQMFLVHFMVARKH